jgi:hypothetical protein
LGLPQKPSPGKKPGAFTVAARFAGEERDSELIRRLKIQL